MPDQSGRTRRNARVPRPLRRRACPSCSAPPSRRERRRPGRGPAASRSGRAGVGGSAAPSRSCSALGAARRAAGRRRRGPGGDPRPHDRQQTRRTTSSRPSDRVRVTVDLTLDEPPQRHRDQALLLRPGVPRRAARDVAASGSPGPVPARRRVRVTQTTSDYTLLRLDLAQRLYSGKTATYRLRSTSRTRAVPPTRDLRVGDSLVSFPVWAFATDATPGQLGHGRLPEPASTSRSRPATSRRPTTDADGRTIFQTGVARQAARRSSPISSPTGPAPTRATTVDGDGAATTPVELIVRSWPDDAAVGEARRRPARARPARSSASEIGLPWPHDGRRSRSRRPSAARPAATPACSIPSADRVEIAYYADDVRRPPRGRPRLVQRRRSWPIAGRTRRSRRTTREQAAAELKIKAQPATS